MVSINNLFKTLCREHTKSEEVGQRKYPVAELAELVGKEIRVEYIEGSRERNEKGILVFEPREDAFYIGKSNMEFHQVCWDRTDTSGNRYAVKNLSYDGKTIYENKEI